MFYIYEFYEFYVFYVYILGVGRASNPHASHTRVLILLSRASDHYPSRPPPLPPSPPPPPPVLWAAYCDQYCSDNKTNRNLYGFGAAADAVAYVPLLRNIMGWLSAGSATYAVLLAGLAEGKAASVNAAGRKPKHLYILPGGVAEIFTSTPGRHSIIFKKRRGLVRLAIETQTCMIPCYVFGGTDFYNNLATDGGFFARLSRKTRAGFTLFWGPMGTPVPYAPRVTMVMGEPIHPPKWDKELGPIPVDAIEELHASFLKQMLELFDRYKGAAGYPESQLEVL
jgi:hypothetical protein